MRLPRARVSLLLCAALISLQALMSAPEPDDPQDAVVAKQFKQDYKTFCATAKYWTETYASGAARRRLRALACARPTCRVLNMRCAFARPGSKGEGASLQKLMDMGFEQEQCKQALKSCGGDENRALDLLLSGS